MSARFAFILSFFFSLLAHAGNPGDSLREIIKGKASDSAKVMAYSALSYELIQEPQKINELLSDMADFCEKIKSNHIKALCLRKIGVIYGNLDSYDEALEYTFKSAEIFEKLGDKDGLANCYNNIGSFYNSKGDFTKNMMFHQRAIDYHFKSIDIRTEIHDTDQICNSYNNIANVYMSLGIYNKALEYFGMANEIYKKIGDGNSREMVTMNLGECYKEMGIKENNPGYLRTALHYFLSVLKNYNDSNVNNRYSGGLTSVGQVYCELGNYNIGIPYLEKGLDVSRAIHDKNTMLKCSEILSKAYERTGKHNYALELLRFHLSVKDSLINEKNSASMEQMQALYQTSQKDREIDKLNTEKAIKDAELIRQRTIIFSVIGAIVSILVLVLVLWSRYNLKKKANVQLHDAYQKIEVKNRQITDSINYSKRIQSAILPPKELVSKHLKDFFVYYVPKDIVSGDFYWFSDHNNRLYFIVVDCTGHGVPGALMSMIGNTLLNEIINQKNITEPGDILNHLDKGVKLALRQSGSDSTSQDDGMDVSICCIDKNNPHVLHYATANHSVFVKSGNSVAELTGDIFSIGGDFGNIEKTFENKTHTLEKNSFVVMSSDGYYDQFGGEKDSKFLISRFEELIAKIDLSSEGVEEELDKAILLWRGLQKQTDDILVAGFRV